MGVESVCVLFRLFRNGIEIMSFRRAARVDANQSKVVEAFKSLGCSVLIISQLKRCADLIVANGRKRTAMIEVKDGSKIPSKRQLTKWEKDFMDSWKGLYFIVESLDDVVRVVRELDS